jgi:hypothetical protein
MPEYGGYDSRDEAEEDRVAVVSKIKARRALKIKQHEPEMELTANEFKLAVLLLAKMTKGSMKVNKLREEQRETIALLLYKWKGPGSLGAETLASLDTLKLLLYLEVGIDPSWPEADDAFIEWAKEYVAKVQPEKVQA